MAGVTVGGISADVFCDGYRKGIGPDGPWREILYLLPWGDSDDFLNALKGINTAVVVGGTIIFPLPHQYPGNPILFCDDAWAEPVGTPQPDVTKLFAADKALVHATYRVPRVDIPGTDAANAFGNQSQPWTRDSMRGYTVNYPIPPESANDKGGSDEKPARKLDWLIPHVEYTRHRMMVPYLDPELMEKLVGKINQDVMWNKAIGTIKFDDFDTNPVPQTDGSIMQEITMRFTWRQYDWNYEPSDNGMTWRQWWDPVTHAYRYEYADLMQLFQP